MLAGASIAILAFTESDTKNSNYNPWSQLYGIVLLPVAIAFILYAMYQCKKRFATMICIIVTIGERLTHFRSIMDSLDAVTLQTQDGLI